nr:RNA-directed DNA polymerase, eukaryota [Tanacetum cinerariifolium]
MGAHNKNPLQSKADQPVRIFKSVFVSNFDGCTAKDLWKVCNDYGTMVDVFISNKKSKVGKRFSFVRFIKAKDQFQNGSYVNVVNGSFPVGVHSPSISSASVLVLDDSCVVERDLSNHVMGKVKYVSSISNLWTLIMEERFSVVNLVYLGGLWVMIECVNAETKANMLQHTRVKSWFHVLQNAVHDFGEALDIEDNVDSSFGRKRLCIKTKLPLSILESFKVIFKGKVYMVRAKELFTWNPIFLGQKEMEYTSDEDSDVGPQKVSDHSQFCLGHKTKNKWIKELTSKNKINFMAIQETKTHYVNHMDVKFMWGNSNYNYVYNEAVGNSGSILCVWEATIFKKDYTTISLLYTGHGYLVIPRFFLWLFMLRSRRGSCFNLTSARVFDQFISASGLVDVKMEGYTFTWSHPSGSKMSKLDRFLVSEGIFSIFPSITAVCLDRHLSDHRPIILCEVQADFGPIPFWFYDSWISLEGFDAMVEQTWRSFSHNDANRMIRFKKKIQDLKMESKEYLQKSKIKWAIEGEENSKFFHGLINKKRSQLAIRRVFVDGIWCTNPNKILDGPFILNELLHWCKRNKKQVMFFKVDFTKAYDSIRSDYLLDVLEDFRFGNIWCKWIQGTFSSAKASVLVNCSPTIEFPFHCGLKQGDPLSSYLFILIMESLNMSFPRAIDEGVFKGVHLHGSTSISHLFYADDVMFIGEWFDDNLKGIINILQCFFLASGLKINIQKSQVLGVGAPSSIVMQAASSIGCGVLHKQFRYLGVMVGECMSRHNAWASTMDKLRSNLSKWKVKTFSIGGRLTLLKAVLGPSPLYNMSIFKVPKGILNFMEAIR